MKYNQIIMIKPSSYEQTQTQPQNMSSKGQLASMNLKHTLNLQFWRFLSQDDSKENQNFLKNNFSWKQYYNQTPSSSFIGQQSQGNDLQILKEELIESMEELYNSLYSSYFSRNNQWQTQANYYDEIQDVQDFIQEFALSYQKPQKQKLIDVLKVYSQVRNFMQWTFDASPIAFYKQLILVTSKIILPLFSINHPHSSFTIFNLSHNIVFINHIFNDQSLKIFKVNLQLYSFSQYVLTAPVAILRFIPLFIEKVLKIILRGIKQHQSAKKQTQVFKINEECLQTARTKKTKAISKYQKQA